MALQEPGAEEEVLGLCRALDSAVTCPTLLPQAGSPRAKDFLMVQVVQVVLAVLEVLDLGKLSPSPLDLVDHQDLTVKITSEALQLPVLLKREDLHPLALAHQSPQHPLSLRSRSRWLGRPKMHPLLQ